MTNEELCEKLDFQKLMQRCEANDLADTILFGFPDDQVRLAKRIKARNKAIERMVWLLTE